jgi:hypothetical protein
VAQFSRWHNVNPPRAVRGKQTENIMKAETSLKRFVNEIVDRPNGRTICGEIAHALAAVTPSGAFIGQPFQMWERVKGGTWVLRAAQSTREGAMRYFQPGHVLVCLNS